MWSWRETLVVCVLLGGCGGDPDPRPERGAGGSMAAPPIGTEGGSGGAGGGTAAVPNCFELCAWEVEVAGDCPVDSLDQCKAAFLTYTLGGDTDCIATLDAWCDCLRDYADPEMISCTEGPVTSNIPVLSGTPAACDELTNAWIACNQ